MAEAKFEWEKTFSYWKKVFRRTLRETEIISVIKEAIVGGVIPPFLGLLVKLFAKDEVKELIFLAVSGAAALILIPFIFRLVFVTPEKMLRESEKKSHPSQSIEGAPKPARGVLGTVILGALCIGAVLILIVQIYRNSNLQEQVAELKMLTNSIPKRASLKPLPTQSIPRPEPPPPKAASVAQAPPEPTDTNKPFENFGIDTTNTEFTAIMAKKMAERAKEASNKEQERTKSAQNNWSSDVKLFRHALVTLHDSLLQSAAEKGDGISQSEDFLQSLPDSIDIKTDYFKTAEIKLRNNTNVDFMISVGELDGNNRRALIISCGAGALKTGWGGEKSWYYEMHVKPNYDDIAHTNYENAAAFIETSVKDLISAQYYFLSVTNKP